MAAQVMTQERRWLPLIWSGSVSGVLFFVVDKLIGLRPSADVDCKGLDTNEHGERAYNIRQ